MNFSNKSFLFAMIFCLLMASCTPWRINYLRNVVNRSTEDDVAKRLGPPHFTRGLSDGGTVWSYQYRINQTVLVFVGSSVNVPSNVCTEYILVFDANKILRNWHQEEC